MRDDAGETVGLDWGERVEKGREAEEIVIPLFLSEGWSVQPSGVARVNSPVPHLRTPRGRVRPVDFFAWHPKAGRPLSVEVKSKTVMGLLQGYGLDRTDGQDDPWVELQRHNRCAGPVLLVIWDTEKQQALAATVEVLAASGGPNTTKNGLYWWWPRSVFISLDKFLKGWCQ